MKIIAVAFLLFILNISVFSQDSISNSKNHEIGVVFSNLNSFGLRYKYGNENLKIRVTSLVFNGTNTTKNDNNDNSIYSLNGSNISNTLGAGLRLGLEKSICINKKSCFIYGIEWINSYSSSQTSTITPSQSFYYYTDNNNQNVNLNSIFNNSSSSNSWNLSSGFGLFVGLTYKINESFSVITEIEPSISYLYSSATTSTTTNGVNWNGNSTTGYTPTVYEVNTISQKTINKGLNYGLSNSAASITILYKLK